MVAKSKDYKKCLNMAYRHYTRNLQLTIRNLEKTNTKEYWKIINKDKSTDQAGNIELDTFAEHFKNLGEEEGTADDVPFKLQDINISQNEELNLPFTLEEVRQAANKLKSNKASGIDHIINEFLKNSPMEMFQVLTGLFNLVLMTGMIPEDWSIGIIKPIYKKKGSADDPDNYRGITLLSCIGKLFTALLNERLTKHLELNGIIGEDQTGFRSGYSTLDHVFTMKSLLDIYLSKKERVWCAFVDYKKAFDMVDRQSLWLKLLSYGINGKILTVIHNLYDKAKSCVKHNGSLSELFTCSVGVRQGENLSPLLFAIYLNDLESHLKKKYRGLDFLAETVNLLLADDDTELFLRLYVLLYADSPFVVAETPHDLQIALDTLIEYCNMWKLIVNTTKTKNSYVLPR